MPTCKLTEDEIVSGLRSEEESLRRRTQRMLYTDDQVNRSVKGYVQKRFGTWDQAQEVFDYAFIQFDAKVRNEEYPGTNVSDNNWRKMLCGIGYLAWNYKKYGQKEMLALDQWKDTYDPIDSIQENDLEIDLESIFLLLEKCGKNCRFIFEKEIEGFNLEEIAGMLSISHENSRKRKSNCMKELRNKI